MEPARTAELVLADAAATGTAGAVLLDDLPTGVLAIDGSAVVRDANREVGRTVGWDDHAVGQSLLAGPSAPASASAPGPEALGKGSLRARRRVTGPVPRWSPRLSTLPGMRVEVNSDLCQGHNRCYALAPELFDVDDYGNAMVIGDGAVGDGLEEKARLAAANCPEYAITIVDG